MGSEVTIREQQEFAQLAQGAGIVPQAYRGKPADIFVAVNFGDSIGLNPAESLYRINVIQGKPTMSAELILSKVREAGHKLRIIKDEKNMSVTAQIIRADDPDFTFEETRDAKWAQAMGLANKDNYKKQPMTMLKWRAVTAVAREACPEALYGAGYTADELHDNDTVTATVVEEPTVILATKAQQAQWGKLMRAHNVQTSDDGTRILRALTGLSDVQRMKDVPADIAKSVLADSDLDQKITSLMSGEAPSQIIDAQIVEEG